MSAFTSVNIALLAPIPIARTRTATSVKPGAFANDRIAKRRSWTIWSSDGVLGVGVSDRARKSPISAHSVGNPGIFAPGEAIGGGVRGEVMNHERGRSGGRRDRGEG